MITGDNTLTGSNISYKCDISNKSKGMIICDFNEGRFVQDLFNFQDDDESTDVSNKNKNHDIPYTEIVINNNKIAPIDSPQIELQDNVNSNERLNK